MNPESTNRHTTLAVELADTHALLQDLRTAIDSLTQATTQLSWEHNRTARGHRQATGDTADAAIKDAAAQLVVLNLP